MNSKEYVIWLKGFVEACHEYTPTPKQWDTLKDKLGEVKDEEIPTFPFGVPHTTPNTYPFPTWQHSQRINPHYIGDVPSINQPFISTTTGSVSISVSNGLGSTSTTYGYPSGSAWSYTNNTYNPSSHLSGGGSRDGVISKDLSNQLEMDFTKSVI